MQVSYDKLWKLMIDKKINKTQLKDMTGITSNCMAKMGKNKPIHMAALVKICEVLDCEINDIVERTHNEVIENEKI